MDDPAVRLSHPPTLADIDALPAHMKGEILDGVFYAMTRTRAITVVPDWICEVLSSTTRRYDLRTKKPFYAKVGVPFLWVVDPAAQVVTALRLDGGAWVELGVWSDEPNARIPPFDAVGIDVAAWWEGIGEDED